MNLSAAYNEMGDFKKALASSKEGIVELTPIAMKDKDPEMVRILLIAYFNCGLYESELKNLESARRWFEKGKHDKVLAGAWFAARRVPEKVATNGRQQ